MSNKNSFVDENLNVLLNQKQKIHDSGKTIKETNQILSDRIAESEALLDSLNIDRSTVPVPDYKEKIALKNMVSLRPWDELIREIDITESISILDLLSDEEIEKAICLQAQLREDFNTLHRLDVVDWTISSTAGILASAVDIFLVQMPNSPGIMGGKTTEGGQLSNYIKNKINSTLSPEEIKKLERRNWVPFDPAHSDNLAQKVEGLGPSTHRLHSLGHDPILGFIFGVKDILCNTFTAIDKNGVLSSQLVDTVGKDTVGMNLFEAIARVFGHMLSDVTSSAGLPVPLMGLYQKLKFGDFGGRNISEIVRLMYYKGYDFRHFISMSIVPLIIEVVIRIGYLAKCLSEGNSLEDSIPLNIPGNIKPKLQTMLFTGHFIATAANAGKVAFTQNPLAINYPQWVEFFRYSVPQLQWILFEKEDQRHIHVMRKIDEDWLDIQRDIEKTWEMVSGDIYLFK